MQDSIAGTVMPVLIVNLDPGESVISEAGEFSWMSDSVELSTGMGGGAGGKGLLGAVKRVAGGSSFLFNTYTVSSVPGMVAFAAKVPGSIFPIEINSSSQYLAHRHGFLAGTPGIEISSGFQQSFRGGIFGGEGFVLQRIGGEGRAWVELSGEVVSYELAAGQTIKAHPGHVGLFEASVSFQVLRVQGLANHWLGADGHHFVALTGPGRVWLQSMPVPILAGSIARYIPKEDGHAAESGAAAGSVAGVLGGFLGGR